MSTIAESRIDQESLMSTHSRHPSVVVEPTDEVFRTFFQDEKYVTYPSKLKVLLSFNPKEVELIRNSWQLIISDTKNAATTSTQQNSTASFASSLFCHQLYDNLLDMKPDLIDMFPSIKHQAVAFAGIMNVAIINLEKLEVLDNVLEHLGRTHSRVLGIESAFFELMGDALIKTFEDRFFKAEMDFTIELEDCWIKMYCFLANSIIQSGIDPVLRYDKYQSVIVGHRKPSLLSSIVSSVSSTDQESLLDEKISRVTSSTSGTLSIASNPTPILKKSATQSTRQAFKNMRSLSNNRLSTDGVILGKMKASNSISKNMTTKNQKKKDGTCIVM